MIHIGAPGIQGARTSLIDYNRAGIPLIEIVTEPELHSAQEAVDFVRWVRLLLYRLGICDGRMAEGSLRCDANLSIRKSDKNTPVSKTELKNLNSFRAIERSLEFEFRRHVNCLREGRPVRPETRLWDEASRQTFLLRSKESSPDYKYFPEPDLPPLIIDPAMINEMRAQMQTSPFDKKQEYITEYGLPEDQAQLLIEHPDYEQFFLAVIDHYPDVRVVANWFFNRLLSHTDTLTDLPVSAAEFADFLQHIEHADISANLAADLLAQSFQKNQSLQEIMAGQDLQPVHESSTIESWCRAVLHEFPERVTEYNAGKVQLLGFFIGQVMQKSQPRAEPRLVKSILLQILKP